MKKEKLLKNVRLISSLIVSATMFYIIFSIFLSFAYTENSENKLIIISDSTLKPLDISDYEDGSQLDLSSIRTEEQINGENIAVHTIPTTISINKSVSTDKQIQVSIPAGVKMSSSKEWNSLFNLPIYIEENQQHLGIVEVTTKAFDVDTVELGAGDTKIILDKPVRILLKGQNGKRIGYSRTGQFTPIFRLLSTDSASALSENIEDGYLYVENDLVVWTKHLTKFIVYQEDLTPPKLFMEVKADGVSKADKSYVRGMLSMFVSSTDLANTGEGASGLKDVKIFRGLTLLTTSTSSSFTFSLDTTKMSNTKHTFKILTTDNVGNVDVSWRTYTVDNVKPTIQSTYTFPTNPIKNRDAKAYYKVNDNFAPYVYVTLQIKTTTGKVLTSLSVGRKAKGKLFYKSIKMPSKAGSYIYSVVAKDYAGNKFAKKIKIIVSDVFNISYVKDHLYILSRKIGVREKGTYKEHKAAKYIKTILGNMGYSPILQNFKLPNNKTSYNIIAQKFGKVKSKKLIIGAHYDSIKPSPGANDNASGTALLLELARLLYPLNLEPNIIFTFFGAEEGGINPRVHSHHYGSHYYVKILSYKDRKQIVGMINVDMVGFGKKFHVRSMKKSPMTIVDDLLGFSRQKRYSLTFLKDFGRTGWSDHEPFELVGIPVAWLQWRKDSYWHTKKDTYNHIQWSKINTTGNFLQQYIIEKNF